MSHPLERLVDGEPDVPQLALPIHDVRGVPVDPAHRDRELRAVLEGVIQASAARDAGVVLLPRELTNAVVERPSPLDAQLLLDLDVDQVEEAVLGHDGHRVVVPLAVLAVDLVPALVLDVRSLVLTPIAVIDGEPDARGGTPGQRG